MATAIRGQALTFKDDPFVKDLNECMVYEKDALIVIEDGVITQFGAAKTLLKTAVDALEFNLQM